MCQILIPILGWHFPSSCSPRKSFASGKRSSANGNGARKYLGPVNQLLAEHLNSLNVGKSQYCYWLLKKIGTEIIDKSIQIHVIKLRVFWSLQGKSILYALNPFQLVETDKLKDIEENLKNGKDMAKTSSQWNSWNVGKMEAWWIQEKVCQDSPSLIDDGLDVGHQCGKPMGNLGETWGNIAEIKTLGCGIEVGLNYLGNEMNLGWAYNISN